MNKLQEIEMSQSLKQKQSSYSYQISNEQNKDLIKKHIKYRCYNCGGDQQKSSTCRTCNGFKQVKDNNIMVQLMFQVMCCKLGKDVPTLRNFPKLEFSSQHKIGPKSNKNKGDQKLKDKVIKNNPSSKINRQHHSEGNSLNDSNSLDSSLDSLDSSKNNRSAINNKQKKQKSKSSRNSNSYLNQPHFKQQISQIKEQSYFTQDYSVVCQCCHKQCQVGCQFLECRKCKHYFICIKCYEYKLQQIRNQTVLPNSSKILMKRQKSLTTTFQQSQLILAYPQKQTLQKYKSCEYKTESIMEDQKIQIVNYDNYYKIHEHPLTRYTFHNEDYENDFKKNQYGHQDYIREDGKRSDQQNKDQIYLSQGKVYENMNIKQSQKQGGSISYKNLFKVYDFPEIPSSPTKRLQTSISFPSQNSFISFQVIKQQKQSPSPSQKSSQVRQKSNPRQSQQIKQEQYDFDNNISITISNNLQSPESCKFIADKKDSCESKGQVDSMSGSGESPMNSKVNKSYGSQQQDQVKMKLKKNNLQNDSTLWDNKLQLSMKYPTQKSTSFDQNKQKHNKIQEDQKIDNLPLEVIYSYREKQLQKNYALSAKALQRFQQNKTRNKYYEPLIAPLQHNSSNLLQLPNNISDNIHQPQQQQYFFPSALIRLESTQTQTKKCSNCYHQISNMSMYMVCKTCEKDGKPLYQLCANCNSNKQVIKKHGNQHIFKCYLNKKQKMQGINSIQDDQQEQEHKILRDQFGKEKNDFKFITQQKNTGKNIIKSTNSFFLQPQEQTPQKSQIKYQLQSKLAQPNQIKSATKPTYFSQSSQALYHRKSDEQNNQQQKIRYQNQKYLKSRQKKCEQNSKYLNMFGSFNSQLRKSGFGSDSQRNSLIDGLQNSVYIDVGGGKQQKKERENQKERESSGYFRYSTVSNQNLQIGGRWLNQTNRRQHDSYSCVPFKQSTYSCIPFKDSIYETNQNQNTQIKLSLSAVAQKQQKKTSKQQNIFNKPAIIPNIKQNIQDLVQISKSMDSMPNQNIGQKNQNIQIQNVSICFTNGDDEQKYINNNASNFSLDNSKIPFANSKQSPDRSIYSMKSGSPRRSQLSSRVKVDCGDSDSQFDQTKILSDICQIQNKMEGVKVNKSIKLQNNNNILGNPLAISQYSYSDQSQKNQSNFIFNQANQNAKKIDNFGAFNSQKYKLNTNKCLEEEDQQDNKIRQKSKSSHEDNRITGTKKFIDLNDQKSRSSSKSSTKKNIRGSLIMGFLGQVQKSQKLSNNSDDEINQMKLKNYDSKQGKIHFNIEDLEKPNISQQNKNLNQDQQNQQQSENEDFIFQNYNCNQCGQEPVKFRYSCQKCMDYDLCIKCFKQSYRFHQHKQLDFLKIDKIAEKKIQQQLQNKQKFMQQQRNKIISTLIQKFVPNKQIQPQIIQKPSFNNSIRNNIEGKPSITNLNNNNSQRMTHSLAPNWQKNSVSRQMGLGRSINM